MAALTQLFATQSPHPTCSFHHASKLQSSGTLSCSLFVQPHLPISLGSRNPPHEAQEVLFQTASVLTATAEIHTKVMLPTNCPEDRARGKGFSYCSMDDLPQTAFLLLPRHMAKAISVLVYASCSAVLKLCLGMAC